MSDHRSSVWWEGYAVGGMNERLALLHDSERFPLFPVAAFDEALKLAAQHGYDLVTDSGKPLTAEGVAPLDDTAVIAKINSHGRAMRLMPVMERLPAGHFEAWLSMLSSVDQDALWDEAVRLMNRYPARARTTLEIGAERYGRPYAAGSFLRATCTRTARGDGTPRGWERDMRHSPAQLT